MQTIAMTYLPANYTKVDAAIAKANALNKDNYMDFSGVEAAVNAVVRGKNITEQSEVDAMAKVIEEAINALVRKSSGGDDSDPTYAIEVGEDIRNGTVTANRRYAERGDTVTITVKPDDGFKLDDLTVTDKNGKELKLTDKGNGKYTFTMPASKVEIKATFVKEVETSPFSDVSTSAYYYEAVKWAQEKDITGGIGNGLFGPNQPCTRAQIVTFLWRAASLMFLRTAIMLRQLRGRWRTVSPQERAMANSVLMPPAPVSRRSHSSIEPPAAPQSVAAARSVMWQRMPIMLMQSHGRRRTA